MFFLLYFFDVDVRYAVFSASVSSMFLSLCFKYMNGFRLAVTLSLVDYGSYYANLFLWILLTSLILNGPAVRLESKYESYAITVKCGGETINSATSRAYQQGLNHVHHVIENSFSSWNETTKEVSKALQQVGAAMYQLSLQMEKLLNTVNDFKTKCYKDTTGALMYCQEKMRELKKNCVVTVKPYHYLCEIFYVPVKLCEKIMETDVCSRLTLFSPMQHASTFLKQQAKEVETALHLKVKTMSLIAVDSNYEHVRHIYEKLATETKSVVSRTIFVWNIMGIIFAIAFIMKPIQNYMLVLKYDSLSSEGKRLSRFVMCLLYGLVCSVSYVTDVLSSKYVCKNEHDSFVGHNIQVTVNTSMEISGGVVAVTVANAVLKELEKSSNITVVENLYDCLPFCTAESHYFEMTVSIMLLLASVFTICITGKVFNCELRLLDYLMCQQGE